MSWKKVGERHYQNDLGVTIVGHVWCGGADWKCYDTAQHLIDSASTLTKLKAKIETEHIYDEAGRLVEYVKRVRS